LTWSHRTRPPYLLNGILKFALSAIQIVKRLGALITPVACSNALLIRRERPLNLFQGN
jgi:hypothetical protein